jgi:NAD(P)-dependent dehydrogenase (short-subunit alcohol dehydrogenase family)
MKSHGRVEASFHAGLHHLIHARGVGHAGAGEHGVHLQGELCAAAVPFENIRVNTVCPGDTFVERWMDASRGYFEGSDPVTFEKARNESSAYIPMGRFGKSEEIAQAVLFLASDDSSFVTGQLLLVDGGNTAQ